MSAKWIWILFFCILCQIESVYSSETNGISSCTYFSTSVTFSCSGASNDDLSFFNKIEYTNCQIEHGFNRSFERSEVATVSFRNCKRNGLPMSLFDVYKGMQTLNVTQMSLETLADLDRVTSLTNLLASHNKLSRFPKLPKGIQVIDLSNNNLVIECDTFQIEESVLILNLAFNNISELCGGFSQLSPSLEILNLTNNKIKLIPDNLFAVASKLHTIDLSHNDLKTIGKMNVVQPNQVKIISLNDNQISHLDVDVFENFSKCEKLSLSNNQLVVKMNSSTSNIFKSLKNLINLDISSNQFEELDSQMFPESSKLERLNIHDIKIKTLDRELFEKLSNVKYLDLSSNPIKTLSDDVFDSLSKLKYLDLSQNLLKIIPENMFKQLKLLKHVNISHMDVSVISPKTFSSQSELEALDISGNPIPNLDSKIFATEMSQLTSLVIKSCRMKTLEGFRKESFPRLKIVGIDQNNDFNCTVYEMLSVESDNNRLDNRCPIEYWTSDKITIWCLSAVVIILVIIIIGGIVWYKLRQRRIDPGFNLSHDYRPNFGQNSRTATIKSRHRPPKTTITEENSYEIPDSYDHLKFP